MSQVSEIALRQDSSELENSLLNTLETFRERKALEESCCCCEEQLIHDEKNTICLHLICLAHKDCLRKWILGNVILEQHQNTLIQCPNSLCRRKIPWIEIEECARNVFEGKGNSSFFQNVFLFKIY